MAVEMTESSVDSRLATKKANVAEAAPAHRHRQVVAAGHKVDAFHLVKQADLFRDFLESAVGLRGDPQLDEAVARWRRCAPS